MVLLVTGVTDDVMVVFVFMVGDVPMRVTSVTDGVMVVFVFVMDPCELFLLEYSSSSDDSDLEELLDDELEQTAGILTVAEVTDVRPKKRKGSTMGRLCIPRNRALGHILFMRAYCAEVPTYPPHFFRCRYRMRRSLFNKIIAMCEDNTRYFKRKRNAAGLMGFSAHQKVSAVMCIFAYDIPADYADDYIVNGREYIMWYYLADGIYPDWVTFVKTIREPENRAEAEFAKAQEAARKDIERAFSVLQARFAIVRGPARFWDMDTLKDIMTTCVILHNMIIEDGG
ncbi:uncharacterized protein [Lolium perenne]|uniref:uncharacterized protein n=1 Tax=Lolium perenne TaxID=4522 RepID=UPI003A99D214